MLLPDWAVSPGFSRCCGWAGKVLTAGLASASSSEKLSVTEERLGEGWAPSCQLRDCGKWSLRKHHPRCFLSSFLVKEERHIYIDAYAHVHRHIFYINVLPRSENTHKLLGKEANQKTRDQGGQLTTWAAWSLTPSPLLTCSADFSKSINLPAFYFLTC